MPFMLLAILLWLTYWSHLLSPYLVSMIFTACLSKMVILFFYLYVVFTFLRTLQISFICLFCSFAFLSFFLLLYFFYFHFSSFSLLSFSISFFLLKYISSIVPFPHPWIFHYFFPLLSFTFIFPFLFSLTFSFFYFSTFLSIFPPLFSFRLFSFTFHSLFIFLYLLF